MTWAVTAAVVGIAGSAALGASQNRRNQRTNEAASRAGDLRDLGNAQENREVAIQNSGILRAVGGMNAAQILEVGSLNSDFILNSMERNIDLMRIEQKEELRRHINEEMESAGMIRAGYSGSGVSVSSGSALAAKITSMREAELDRLYQDNVTNEQILGYFETETERAYITRREAELGAEAELFNAEAEATMVMAEANAYLNNATRNAIETGGITAASPNVPKSEYVLR